MAGLFDEILSQVEENDKAILKKYPKIQEKVEQLDSYVSRWEQWRTNNWDSEANTTKGAAEALRSKDAELAALKAMQETGMDWTDMEQNVRTLIANSLKEQGYLNKTQVEAEILAKVPKADELQKVRDRLDQIDRGITFTYSKTGHFPMKYYREFGDGEGVPEYTQEAFLKHMNDTQTWDPDKAYDTFVAPLRKAKEAKDLEKTKEEIRREERAKVLREQEMKRSALPDDQTGNSPDFSALQLRIAARKKIELEGAPKLTPGSLGDFTGANDAYQAYLKDMQAGTKPPQVQ